jgi:parallel beta helix pectate lyase-like protein
MRKFIGITVAVALATAILAPAASAAVGQRKLVERVAAGLWKVHPGGSIQEAVDKASPGDTVSVAPGIYHQTVLIQKNGITLRGAGANLTIIKPPKSPKGQPCFKQSGSGICVFGRFDDQFNLVGRTKNVTVTGFGVRNFPGFGVFAFGGAKLSYRNNIAVNNGEYGLARFNTLGGSIVGNVTKSSGEAGIYVGDSAPANVLVADNRSTDSELGFFIRHAHGVTLSHNVATGNCQGILVLDDGQPGGAGDVTAKYNVVNANNKSCSGHEGEPPLKGGGILLLGATDSTVAWNTIRHNRGGEINSGGIVMASSEPLTGGKAAKNNLVKRNLAYGNRPGDLIWDGEGTGNTFVGNACGKSIPAGSC